MLLLFKAIEKFLSLYTGIKTERVSEGYQGGERMPVTESRYATTIFPISMLYLVLHVLGFIAATIYVLVAANVSPLNWTTLFFGILMLYTIILIRRGMK
ncbi:MAG: hypothetical protein INQ03_06350 [Candidatus Heimdallarchaeota archaeon]|nr:hypothetical protein [Candidatus Heimdallarchaeota archaeon]